MAKFIVTNGSHFTPFTYDELAKPLMQAVEAHTSAQNAYDAISSETAQLQRYITDNPGDEKAKKLYDDYVARLSSLQENLWNNGYGAGTRRDLSEARAGFFGDVSRIAAAVKTRKERSDAYHKMKLEHPDMIMGEDPGLSGLDAYLDNDLYGQDYFTYSGKSFADEVGAEVKARGNQMLSDPEISRDPRLVGYITQKLSDGFTNDEVDNAMAFVRGKLNAKDENTATSDLLDRALSEIDNGTDVGLSSSEEILAGALLSRLKSTGAAGNVSDSEFGRLVDYGQIGLAQGVGKTSMTNLHDLEWAERQKINLESLRYTHALAETAAKEGNNGDPTVHNYEIPSFYLRIQGDRADKQTAKIGEFFGKVSEDNPLNVKLPDGNWAKATTPDQAADLLYHNKYREAALTDLGFDTSKSKRKQQTSHIAYTVDGVTKDYTIRTNYKDGKVIVEAQAPNGTWHKWDELTERYNGYLQDDEDYRKQIEEINGIKLSDYDNSPKDEEKFRAEFDIDDPNGKLREYYRPIAEIKTMLGQEKPAMLVGPTNTAVLADYAAEISNAYVANKPTNKKDNHFAFYALGPDMQIKEKNKVSFDKVFAVDDEMNIKSGSLKSISALPRLLVDGPGYLIISTNNGLFAMDAHMLDTALGSALYGSQNNPIGVVKAVDLLMSPFTNPEDMFGMGEDDDKAFTDFTMSVFDGGYDIRRGTYGAKTKEIMANPTSRNEYYGSIVNLINASFAQPREVLGLLNYQIHGDTNAKALPMFTNNK